MNAPHRAGFSFVEALVVLAITGALLILLAQVAGGATHAGFRVAARADAAADRLVGAEALRAILRGVRLPRPGRSSTAFEGGPDGFTAAVTSGRPTPCGSGAPQLLAVRVQHDGDRARLVCATPGRHGATLLDLGAATGAFAYALAGRPWADRLTAEPAPQRQGGPPPPAARLWIRFASAEGPEVLDGPDVPSPPAAAAS